MLLRQALDRLRERYRRGGKEEAYHAPLSAQPSAGSHDVLRGLLAGRWWTRSIAGSTHSDIYSLGAVLYEMLTDRPPSDVKAMQRLHPTKWVPVLARARSQTARDATQDFDGAPTALPMPFLVNGYYPAPLTFHREAGSLAGTLEGGGFAVYDLRSSVPLLRQRCASAPIVTALGFTRHTRRLAVGTEDRRMMLWDWEQALPLLSFPLHSYCASVAFSPDGKWLAYTDYDPSLVLLQAEPRPPQNNLRGN